MKVLNFFLILKILKISKNSNFWNFFFNFFFEIFFWNFFFEIFFFENFLFANFFFKILFLKFFLKIWNGGGDGGSDGESTGVTRVTGMTGVVKLTRGRYPPSDLDCLSRQDSKNIAHCSVSVSVILLASLSLSLWLGAGGWSGWSSYDVRMISKGCPDHTVTHSILYMFVIVCSSEVFERLWNPRLTPDSQDGETGRHLISPINIAHFSYFHIFHISKLLY